MSEPRVLIAAEGMAYTNGEVYGKEIWLGVNDDPANWHEVPESAMPDPLAEPATEEDYLAALERFGVK
jgi:hypothetical protein